jgi:hypothetical protein
MVQHQRKPLLCPKVGKTPKFRQNHLIKVEDGGGYCVTNANNIANSAPTTPGINHHQQHPIQMAEGGMFAMPLVNQQMTGGGQS